MHSMTCLQSHSDEPVHVHTKVEQFPRRFSLSDAVSHVDVSFATNAHVLVSSDRAVRTRGPTGHGIHGPSCTSWSRRVVSDAVLYIPISGACSSGWSNGLRFSELQE